MLRPPPRAGAGVPAGPTAEITSDAHAARAGARMEQLWALAEARWQEGGRPRRFIGCSYFVVNSNQHADRSAYLSEAESCEVHQLTMQHSLYVNDPRRAHERVLARLAMLRTRRAVIAGQLLLGRGNGGGGLGIYTAWAGAGAPVRRASSTGPMSLPACGSSCRPCSRPCWPTSSASSAR